MQIRNIQGRTASAAELEAVHSSEHVAAMKQKAEENAPCVVADFEETPDNTTYMAQSSFDDALEVRCFPAPACSLMRSSLQDIKEAINATD